MLVIDDVHWGYQPCWAKGKIPVAINTRREKITGEYWAGLLKVGCVIVPADGWYEWTGDNGEKQPWHIHRGDGGALYFAGLAGATRPDDEHKPAEGFTIVTDDAQGGMVDVHDRRPIVFTAEDAKVWLDPETSPEHAEQLAREAALGPEQFEWFRVNRAVGNIRNQGPKLVERVD
ncbi:SOS response-associated peptidase family protein [[Empedobacter] haloabium]|uniref:Abasic site processing protein n=1 Tax=[Empedobacter] haloabium TaxID=592317 RepID=A0ABZ1URC5_9BURK